MGGGEVIKRGWLIKSPPLEGGGIKAWRRRYFMLRSSKVLEYYKSADGDILKGVINLEDCKTVHSDLSHKKYKHVFDVETRDRTYYLVAHSQEEMKEWVDVLCRVCGLIVQDVPDFLESTPPVPPVTAAGGTGPATAGPTISSPIYSTPPLRGSGVYATPPNRGEGVGSGVYGSRARPDSGASGGEGGGISFNERFRPSGEGAGLESMYSLAHSVDAEVQRQLSGEQAIPAGTPLSEALASKGMSSINRSSSVSSASGGDATASFNPDSPSFLSPRHEQASVSQNLYSPVPKKPTSTSNSTSSGGLTRPVPKPRSATLLPTSPRTADQLGSPGQQQLTASLSVSGSMTLGHHAQLPQEDLTPDGYLKPKPRITSNYDRLPPGPPRPATAQNPQTSPRQHRSALLNPTTPMSPSSKDATPPSSHTNNPTYINVKAGAEEAPPMIDRRCKPAMPSPPRVDRNLKPRNGSEDTPPISRTSSSSSSDSPPQFPTRTTSLTNPEAPEFPVRTTSLEGSMAAMGGRVDDGALDLPKPSTRTTQYTQVAFSSTTGNPILGGGGGGGGDGNPPGTSPKDPRRNPVPAPRRRVNYSDVDLVASGKLSEKLSEAAIVTAGAAARSGQREIKVSLTEAEEQELRDKPYINVDRKGKVDEATDPGYYMHMRNLTYQEALEIYNMPIESIDNEDDEEEEEGLSNGIS